MPCDLNMSGSDRKTSGLSPCGHNVRATAVSLLGDWQRYKYDPDKSPLTTLHVFTGHWRDEKTAWRKQHPAERMPASLKRPQFVSSDLGITVYTASPSFAGIQARWQTFVVTIFILLKLLFDDTGMTWRCFIKPKCPGIISVFHFAKCRNGTETWEEKRQKAVILFLVTPSLLRLETLWADLTFGHQADDVSRRLLPFKPLTQAHDTLRLHQEPFFCFCFLFFFSPYLWLYGSSRTERQGCRKDKTHRAVGKQQKKKNERPDDVFCKYYDKGFQE